MITTFKPAGGLSPVEKKEKIQLHRDYHTALLQENNVADSDFNVKVVFSNNNIKVVGIFPSEFKKQNGFYMEFVDKNLDPTDPDRRVYRLEPRENYEDVYPLLQSGSYAVPISELTEVRVVKSEPVMPDLNIDLNLNNINPSDDEHYSKMTIKDLAAILWQLPVSNKPWLNKLVEDVKNQNP